ncbi:hypothetical protein [Micromonospora sp. Llam0]|uniref:hypothetical protein n=1 Tax=Micromonospora sp. Llam0 TaxID=2485143 RepID=UPI000F46E77F|nr:hypothetical protein [Micromonospora sp. Llam0]
MITPAEMARAWLSQAPSLPGQGEIDRRQYFAQGPGCGGENRPVSPSTTNKGTHLTTPTYSSGPPTGSPDSEVLAQPGDGAAYSRRGDGPGGAAEAIDERRRVTLAAAC